MLEPKLSFLADESLEYRIVLHLRKGGYDIVSIAEDSPSIPIVAHFANISSQNELTSVYTRSILKCEGYITDKDILKQAHKEKRVIITNDKDFGDLVYLMKLDHCGIILFRLTNERVIDKMNALTTLFKEHSKDIVNNFIVLGDADIRIRHL